MLINQITTKCDPIKGDTCSGFTAATYSDKAIILAFRGTGPWSQTIEEAIEEVFHKKDIFVGGGNVCYYFNQAFLSIWDNGMRDAFLTSINRYPDYEIWITGHSLGAAIASICAGYITYLDYVLPTKIKLVTFGQPRTGDLGFASYVDQNLPYVYRIIHARDWIPHLPPLSFETGDFSNLTHHKSEIWYNNNMAVGQPHVECDENESLRCSDQLEKNILDLWPWDHDYYFNVSTSFAKTGCPKNSFAI